MSEFFQRLSGSAAGQVPTVTPAPLSRFAPPAGLIPEEDPFSVHVTPPPATMPSATIQAEPLDDTLAQRKTEHPGVAPGPAADAPEVRQPETQPTKSTLEGTVAADEGRFPPKPSQEPESPLNMVVPKGNPEEIGAVPVFESAALAFSKAEIQPDAASSAPEDDPFAVPDRDLVHGNTNPPQLDPPTSRSAPDPAKTQSNQMAETTRSQPPRKSIADPAVAESPFLSSKDTPPGSRRTDSKTRLQSEKPAAREPIANGNSGQESRDPFAEMVAPISHQAAEPPVTEIEKPPFPAPRPSQPIPGQQAEAQVGDWLGMTPPPEAAQPAPSRPDRTTAQNFESRARATDGEPLPREAEPSDPIPKRGPWDPPESNRPVQATPDTVPTASHAKPTSSTRHATSDLGRNAAQPGTKHTDPPFKKPATPTPAKLGAPSPDQPSKVTPGSDLRLQSQVAPNPPARQTAQENPMPFGEVERSRPSSAIAAAQKDPFTPSNPPKASAPKTPSASPESTAPAKSSSKAPVPFSTRPPEPKDPSMPFSKSETEGRTKDDGLRLPDGSSVHIDKVEFQIVKQAPPPPPAMPAPPPREKPSLSDYLKGRKAGQR